VTSEAGSGEAGCGPPAAERVGCRRGPNRADVRSYWNAVHDSYLAHVGTTWQAGRIADGTSMRASNAWLARAAGLGCGQRVLDAGCGVCGPAIDIAQTIAGLRIVGVTLVERQAATARALITQACLSDRVFVVQGDYHAPPFAKGAFDAVLFLESIGYAGDLGVLFAEVRRVLRPGGTLYVKDVFRKESLWSDQERDELAEFDRVYASSTPTLADCADAAAAAGFTGVMPRDLSALVTTGHALRAMLDASGRVTAFGRVHYRRHSCLPVYFGELKARSPL